MFALDDPAGLPLGLRMDVHVETVARHDLLTIPMIAVFFAFQRHFIEGIRIGGVKG